jgi:hypothetical protein
MVGILSVLMLLFPYAAELMDEICI